MPIHHARYSSSPVRLPLENPLREELVNELHVVRLELLHGGHVVALAVQVVRVERPNGLEHVVVLLTHELAVGALAVPRVEGVVTNHGERLVRQDGLVAHDVVEVLVVAPAEHHIVEAAAGAVDAEPGAVDGVVDVRVVGKGAGQDDALVKGAADGERIPDDVPLALGLELREEEHQLAQVVDEARDLHPPRLAVAADGLGGLQQVLNLRERRVRVRLVDERVELLHGLPDGHLGPGAGGVAEAVASGEVVRHSLLLVLLLVKGLDAVAGVLVLAELRLVLGGVEPGPGVVLDRVDVVDGVGNVLEAVADLVGMAVVDRRDGHCDGVGGWRGGELGLTV
ncbi:hypothetical protein TCAP_02983 [Tolypocladium capitatum]|uniref:Uncharacterized protein n=1 Tax=Tolypocladium capitatum TaxID=45235 RepID=A0A2K3QHU2_9HYPO|nr:hypothetical protein TCAP_02983 [Tolypocladium capitatum]